MAYAAARYIEVIPEIEFPAHSDEVFIGYPELCCSGKPYTSGEFCVGNPATFEFMDGVLTEVMELFPSRRIHIGGDEARKGRLENLPQMPVARQGAGWSGRSAVLPDRTCRKIPCRTRPDDGRVGRDTAEQSAAYVRCDFVPRTEGGYRSRQPRVAVMSPGEIIYFDWYQANPHTQPRAMSGFSPIENVQLRTCPRYARKGCGQRVAC